MRIKSVKLCNFKGYRNPKPILLSYDKEKNVTVVFGVMGAGKTSFFEAINWALYGELVVGKGNTIPVMTHLAGKYLLEELRNGQDGELSVEIEFAHDGYDYTLTRTAYFLKEDNRLKYQRGNDSVQLYVVSDTSEPVIYDTKEKERITRIISNILPFSSREYFLFDGEKLDKFAQVDQDREIKNAIRQVLGLTDFDYVKANLDIVKKELRKEYTKLEDDKDKEVLEELIDTAQEKQGKLVNSKLEFQELLDKKKEAFKLNDEKILSFKKELDKINTRRDLEKQRDGLQNGLKAQRKVLQDVLTSAYLPYGQSIIQEAVSLLDEWQKAGKFPAEYYNADFIDKILKKKKGVMKCFCGTTIKEGSEFHKWLKQERKNVKNKKIQDKLTQLFGDFKKLDEKSKGEWVSLKSEHSQFVEIFSELEEIEHQLEEIRAQIKSKITDEEMQECEDLRVSLDTEIIELKRQIDLKGFEIDSVRQQIAAFEEHLDRMDARTDEGKIAKRKLDLVKDALVQLETLHEHYAQEKRKEVEAITKDLFKSIFWKKLHFDDVKLTEDYKLIIPDRWDQEGRATFSAGEREVLSLCFVSALAKSASKDAPFIIDTPFARISNDPTTNIAKHLPEHLNQLVLFVTDKELTVEAEELLLERCEHTWTLKFNEDTSEVDVVAGKHVKTKKGKN